MSYLKSQTEKIFKTDIHYLLHNGAWITMGQGITTVLSFTSAYVFAKHISPTDYGTYKYILSIIGLLSLSTLPSMSKAVLQASAQNVRGFYKTALYTKVKFGLLGLAGSLAVSFYYFLNGNRDLALIFILLSFCAPFLESITLWGSYLAGKKRFKESSIYNTTSQALILVLIILTLIYTLNIYYTIAVFCISTILINFIVHFKISKHITSIEYTEKSKQFLSFGKKLSALNLLGTFVTRIDTLILWHFLGPVAVAQFAFALATTTPIKTFLKTLLNLAHPKFSVTQTRVLQKTIVRKILVSLFVFVPFTILYIAILPTIYMTFFPAYEASIVYAQVLSILFIFYPTKLFSTALVTRTEKKPTYIVLFVTPIVHISLLLFLVINYGIWGAVYTQLAIFFFSTFITYYYFRKMK